MLWRAEPGGSARARAPAPQLKYVANFRDRILGYSPKTMDLLTTRTQHATRRFSRLRRSALSWGGFVCGLLVGLLGVLLFGLLGVMWVSRIRLVFCAATKVRITSMATPRITIAPPITSLSISRFRIFDPISIATPTATAKPADTTQRSSHLSWLPSFSLSFLIVPPIRGRGKPDPYPSCRSVHDLSIGGQRSVS